MDTEPANVEQPKHPTSQLTSGELSRYQKELEHAVARLGQAPVVADLRAKLAEVLAEQEQRESIRRAARRGAPGL